MQGEHQEVAEMYTYSFQTGLCGLVVDMLDAEPQRRQNASSSLSEFEDWACKN